jgi:hypothetical protein
MELRFKITCSGECRKRKRERGHDVQELEDQTRRRRCEGRI